MLPYVQSILCRCIFINMLQWRELQWLEFLRYYYFLTFLIIAVVSIWVSEWNIQPKIEEPSCRKKELFGIYCMYNIYIIYSIHIYVCVCVYCKLGILGGNNKWNLKRLLLLYFDISAYCCVQFNGLEAN